MSPRMSRCLLAVAASVRIASACAPDRSPDIHVEGAWVRAVLQAPVAPTNTAAYLEIVNDGPSVDRLIGARSDIAARAEIHRTRIDETGRATMGPAGPVDLPPGSAVQLEPGDLHVMLVGVRRSLAAGDTVRLVLVFDRRGELEVTAEVRPF